MSDDPDVLVLSRFARLAEFFASARKLTAAGHPTLADARALLDILDLSDRLDEEIGGKVFRTRSAGDLPELTFTIRWAVRAGALRKSGGRLVATASWSKLSADKRYAKAAQALLALGPLTARHPGAWPAFTQMFETVDRTVPSLLARLGEGPLDYGLALDQLFDYMEGTYVWSGPWADPANLRRSLERDLAGVCELLEVAGIARLHQGGRGESEGPSAGEGVENDPTVGATTIAATAAGARLIPRLEIPATAPRIYTPGIVPSATVHELHVSLDDVWPPVWRRLIVPSQVSLAGLHQVLQAVMGWDDYHLHEFVVGEVRYGVDDGEGWDEPPLDERRHRLADVVASGDRLKYLYDFGDGWEHTVEVRDVRATSAGDEGPRCLGGARACPPEDAGGSPGYADLLAAIRDPDSDEREHYLEWAGAGFDPDAFDVAEANRRLRRLQG